LKRSFINLDLWVDASTDFGIGILIGNHWAAWKLLPSWKSDGRDIGWAESIALELACMWLCSSEQDLLDADIVVHGDNTSVIDAYKKGRSRNIQRNLSLLKCSFPGISPLPHAMFPPPIILETLIPAANLGYLPCVCVFRFSSVASSVNSLRNEQVFSSIYVRLLPLPVVQVSTG
jgi:hypothetical protein